MADLADWLAGLGLGKYAPAFAEQEIDFDLLPLAGMTHMTPDPVVTERLYERIAGHFQKHLGGPQAKKEP